MCREVVLGQVNDVGKLETVTELFGWRSAKMIVDEHLPHFLIERDGVLVQALFDDMDFLRGQVSHYISGTWRLLTSLPSMAE